MSEKFKNAHCCKAIIFKLSGQYEHSLKVFSNWVNIRQEKENKNCLEFHQNYNGAVFPRKFSAKTIATTGSF